MMKKTTLRDVMVAVFVSGCILACFWAGEAHAAKGKKLAQEPKIEEELDESFDAKLVVDSRTKEAAKEGEKLAAEARFPNEIESKGGNTETEAAIEAEMEAASAAQNVPKPAELPKAELNKLPESAIPVLAKKEEKKSTGGGLARILVTLGVLAVLFGGASYGIRRWSKRTGVNKENTRIKIITQHHLGPKKSLAIIHVAGEAILIGVTDQNISMLKTLSLIDDELPETLPQTFDNAMDEEEMEFQEPVAPKSSRKQLAAREPEDFAMKGLGEIRDVVSSRLRNMRDL